VRNLAVKSLVCIQCPLGCSLEASRHDGEITVTGNKCSKGDDYAREELTNPVRTLTTTVKTGFPDFPRLPVRTNREVPLKSIFLIMEAVNAVLVEKRLQPGDLVLNNLPGTDAALIATDDMTVGDLVR
jgi:CxxC motif-containing protein